MKRVMVFGVFDGVHAGHRAFLRQARALGDTLIAVVAPDSMVEQLKGRRPDAPLEDRMRRLAEEKLADEVLPGDPEMRAWRVLERARPDIIALGYDQTALEEELEAHVRDRAPRPQIVVLEPYRPEVFHSSLLRKGRRGGENTSAPTRG